MLTGTDGLANFMVSYRSSADEEPTTRYDFRVDLPLEDIEDVGFDVNDFKTRTARDWVSTGEPLPDKPVILAWRKGQALRGVGLCTGSPGSCGHPDDFPAERWYLYVSDSVPLIIAEYDPGDTKTIELRQLDRLISDNSLALDQGEKTFSFHASGADPLQFGRLRLTESASSLSWDIYFPYSAVEDTDGDVTFPLPVFVDHPALPAFTHASLELYRLDQSSTADDMIRYLLDGRSNPYPSYAMTEAFTFFE